MHFIYPLLQDGCSRQGSSSLSPDAQQKDQSSISDSVNYSLSLGKSLNLFEFNNNEPREPLNEWNEVKVVGMLCKLYKVIKHELLLLTVFYCRLFLQLLQLV